MPKVVHKLYVFRGFLNFCNSLVGNPSSYFWKDVTCKKCLKIRNKLKKGSDKEDEK